MTKELKSAFALFSENATRLEKAQMALQEKIQELQAEVHESHATLATVVSNLSSGLFFVSSQGFITLFNAEAEKITGKNGGKIVGRLYDDCFTDALFGFSMKDALKRALPPRKIFLNLKNATKMKEIEVTFSCIESGGVLVVLNDITNIRRLERACQQNDRLKEIGEMAAVLAHEIRNPLAGIEGFASLLARELSNTPHESMVKAILEGTSLLNRLVTNVLLYARPLTPHFSACPIGSLLQEVLSFAASFKSANKKYVFKNDSPELTITTDRELLTLAFLHLLRNAFQASNGKEVTIHLFERKTNAYIEVRDEGKGILPEDLEKIFTPFFTTKVNGNGLGLSEVHKIVIALGGTIEVNSKINKGTTFTLTLPKK